VYKFEYFHFMLLLYYSSVGKQLYFYSTTFIRRLQLLIFYTQNENFTEARQRDIFFFDYKGDIIYYIGENILYPGDKLDSLQTLR